MAMGWLLALRLLTADQDKKADRPEFVIIKIQTTLLRERPSYSGTSIHTAKQGEQFKFLDWDGAWVKVIVPPDRVAYVHKSAVIDNKNFEAMPKDQQASIKGFAPGQGGDVAMGTKGFNPQMEAEHKNKNNLYKAYEKLDRIEKTPTYLSDLSQLDRRLAEFAKEGNLKP